MERVTNPGPQHAVGARHRAAPVAASALRAASVARGNPTARGAAARGPAARHAGRRRPGARLRTGLAAFSVAVLLTGVTVAVTAVVSSPPGAAAAASEARRAPAASTQPPPPLASEPTPMVTPLCERPDVTAALAAGDDDRVVAAAGGGAALRDAVVAGEAPCIDLGDPGRVWMVVDKTRPYDPIDYQPVSLARAQGMRVINEGILRTDGGAALAALVAAAREAGAGELAITSGFRSYEDQQHQYGSQVAAGGPDGAAAGSARAGFSEHQSGLAADLVACSRGCSSIEQLASTPQGAWLTENAWRYGFVVRYEEGRTETTGYSPEPWHVRYIGVPLATAYHDGGFHTLEEFWGLPGAPDYAD